MAFHGPLPVIEHTGGGLGTAATEGTHGMKANNYFLKAGYVSLTAVETVEAEPGDYWTPWRIEMASIYQWHVYEAARDVARGMPERPHVLDVGCGYPIKLHRLLAPASASASVTVVDQPTLAGRIAADFPELRFVPVDLERPDADLGARFGLVICSDVLEHLLDPDPCVAFIKRHLAPGGVAVFSTPERDILRGRDCLRSPKPEHVREWNREEFVRYIESHGFRTLRSLLMPQARFTPEQLAACREAPPDSRDCFACHTLIAEPTAP
ncbi:2-polyprenyl-3-methyl-5-hydroxy-6-metoxy-1,4-benzoquinol methylase [Azospirillum brasilense]|nr:2-polyprenyl-3-methyl-5-hydroxy-6-metoxy-1,4-benzoquinol methylase [Azospirillum brasilense]TWB72095.1 2-polyprenyl-3-methyl-5-hydroxy-6-metoxy-1,4-benzoquinol methylase [Azospirillum brasilense]